MHEDILHLPECDFSFFCESIFNLILGSVYKIPLFLLDWIQIVIIYVLKKCRLFDLCNPVIVWLGPVLSLSSLTDRRLLFHRRSLVCCPGLLKRCYFIFLTQWSQVRRISSCKIGNGCCFFVFKKQNRWIFLKSTSPQKSRKVRKEETSQPY